MTTKQINIRTVLNRLREQGIKYRCQGGQVIRCTWSDTMGAWCETPLAYPITTLNNAAARDAGRVLADDETLFPRYGERGVTY